ncbi:UNVERIFIED_CONTAM: hypothetical protein GTU68_059448, partial [Idotea baltica]|nr:hypothetical protein [Idotea baltica]
AADAIFFNQGQVCSAGSRLFVQQGIYDEVVAGVSEIADNMIVGDGFDADTQMGPLVSREQFERVTGYLQAGKDAGAVASAGGMAVDGEAGYFVRPTVLSNASPDMSIVREAIFGPVVAAMPFTNDEEIACQANDSTYGLAAGIWTQDISRAHKLAQAVKAGTVWVNCYSIFDAALPFGGYKQSGWGREMGHAALENYLQSKSVCVKL